MVWPMLIPLAMTVGSQLISGMSQEKTASLQQKEANEFARFRNRQIMTETARQVGELNRQRTAVNMQVQQALASTNKQGAAAESDMNVAFAMSDSIGSTSKVLLSDIERQENEAASVLKYNYETEQLNMNSQLTSLINQGISQYAGITTGAPQAVRAQTTANILNTVGNSFASAYSQGLFSNSAGANTASTIRPAYTGG